MGKRNHGLAVPLLGVQPREALGHMGTETEIRMFSAKESCKSKISVKKTKRNQPNCASVGVFRQ